MSIATSIEPGTASVENGLREVGGISDHLLSAWISGTAVCLEPTGSHAERRDCMRVSSNVDG